MPCHRDQGDSECKLAAAALSQGSVSPPSPAPHCLHVKHKNLTSRDTFWRTEIIIHRLHKL